MEIKKSMYLPKASCFSKTTRYQQISPASSIGRACDFVSLPFSNHQLQNNSLTVLQYWSSPLEITRLGSTPPSGIFPLFFGNNFPMLLIFFMFIYYSMSWISNPRMSLWSKGANTRAWYPHWIDGQTGPTCMWGVCWAPMKVSVWRAKGFSKES